MIGLHLSHAFFAISFVFIHFAFPDCKRTQRITLGRWVCPSSHHIRNCSTVLMAISFCFAFNAFIFVFLHPKISLQTSLFFRSLLRWRVQCGRRRSDISGQSCCCCSDHPIIIFNFAFCAIISADGIVAFIVNDVLYKL